MEIRQAAATHPLFVLLVSAALLLLLSACAQEAPADTTPPALTAISYPFAAPVVVTAPENAASSLMVTAFGLANVHPSGEITGSGTIIYEYIEPCEWQPPEPNHGPAPYCALTGVRDGRFQVQGRVLDLATRADAADPIVAAGFDYLKTLGLAEAGVVPRELELTFVPEQPPEELMDLWGLSQPRIQESRTGAAILGLDGAGLFGTHRLSPVPQDPTAEPLEAGLVDLYGHYGGGTPVTGRGVLKFVRSLDGFPSQTEPSAYLSNPPDYPQWAEPEVPSGEQIELAQRREQEIRELVVLAHQIEESDPSTEYFLWEWNRLVHGSDAPPPQP